MQSSQQPPRVDRATFLENVRASGLIPHERLVRALPHLPESDRGRLIARAMVEQGLLTRFQAERLLGGKTDGFVMGQYRILDELGRGGMGRVYKAEHMTMSRIVALKVLSPQLTQTEKARQLFQREVRAAAKLTHPNIVTAFDANQLGDRCFLVMEFVDGPNLHDLVKEHGPLPVSQAADFIMQAANGLQFAHDAGMVHRDIKPANLLVQKNTSRMNTSSHVVKILDFGLARLNVGEKGEPGDDSIATGKATVMGTPDYLSPEQARSLHNVDGRADIYSLGCAFYYLLTGQVPFPGGTTMEKLVRHSTQAPPSVRAVRPDVSDAMDGILRTMMAKKPDDRFTSAGELAAVIQVNNVTEAQSWIAVDALPVNNNLPVSGVRLPRVGGAPEDPWSNIEESSNGSIPTIDDAAHSTAGANEEIPEDDGAIVARKPRPKAATRVKRGKKPSSGLWVWLVPLLGLGIAIGVIAVIWYTMGDKIK